MYRFLFPPYVVGSIIDAHDVVAIHTLAFEKYVLPVAPMIRARLQRIVGRVSLNSGKQVLLKLWNELLITNGD